MSLWKIWEETSLKLKSKSDPTLPQNIIKEYMIHISVHIYYITIY